MSFFPQIFGSFNNSSFISSRFYPSSASSSSRTMQRHEIFISFRGETCNSFISHLQNALKNKDAITFSDKTSLLNGQTIAYELQKAIKKASIALVVFSKDYASSTWCLDELVKILECKKNGSLIVMPIFYDVDPSDVRKQQNSFAKSFEEHEAERFKNLPEKILSWKNALKEVTALVGVDIRGQDEALCVNKIVNDVLSRLPCAEDLLGIKSRIRKLKIELNSQTNNNELISGLGIYGEAGIGKTTTATALFPHIKGEFDSSCFLGNAKEIKENMNNFRKHALSTIAKLEQGIYDEYDSNMVVVVDETHHQKLLSKRFLLVVDDVEKSEQVDELVAESKWFGVGSKIIITTKNHDLLNRFHRVHKIDLLSDNESRQLFNKHAFKYCNTQTHHHEHCLTHSLRVADYAIGHPLLLKVLGSHFCYLQKEKRLDDLTNSLQRLETIWVDSKTNSIEKIILKLEISLNGLSDSQKKMLIDLACLLFRENNRSEDDLNLPDYYSEEFKVLIEKSLIHVNNEGEVRMHHLIREMSSTNEKRTMENEYRRFKQLWGKEDSFKEKKETIEEQPPTNVVRKKETIEEQPPTNVSYFIEARKLSIACSNDQRYWRWTTDPKSKAELAHLHNVFWLDIEVKIATKLLPSNTLYKAYLIFKIEGNCEGLDKVKGSVGFTNEIAARDEGSTLYITKKRVNGENGVWPHPCLNNTGGLMELKLGMFFKSIGEEREVGIRLFETTDSVPKTGLTVVGIELRTHLNLICGKDW